MKKSCVVLILSLFLQIPLFAQQSNLVYYLTNKGRLVSAKDSADYSMVVSPPDSTIDKTMYIVREYDKNGNVRLVTGSKTNDVNLQYFGRYVAYYPTGKKKSTGVFKDGKLSGSRVEYYPTGKFYNSVNCLPGGRILYNTCMDSTGKTLAENGTGDWIEFDENFVKIATQGKVKDGLRDGAWRERRSDSVTLVSQYKDGRQFSSEEIDNKTGKIFSPIDSVPLFPGGMQALLQFLAKNIKYPRDARLNGTQGKVILAFTVELDGTLTDLHVTRGIGDGCDEESVRVFKISPPWIPGKKDGHPVRVAYSIPISFTLSE